MREYIAPCHFGLESVLKRELTDLNLEVTTVSDGRVSFKGDERALVTASCSLRTAERVLLKTGSFTATSFDELFEGTKAIPWEEYLPVDAHFWVTKAASVKSALFSPSDIQSVMKKAMVERMKTGTKSQTFDESGAPYPVRVFILKDEVTVALDTTGTSLHKRGYRTLEGSAPIAENLAAALIMLTPFKAGRIFMDPFCGSGTFPIEAAMIARNIAPGINRDFTAKAWDNIIPSRLWDEVRDELSAKILPAADADIQGYDIDPSAVSIARSNAKRAGVEGDIHFQVRDVANMSHRKPYGFIVTNPPYGERIGEDTDLFALYRTLGERFRELTDWSLYMITSYRDAEKAIGKKAAKNRKLYNGMIETRFYQYPGPKPGREKR